MPISVWHLIITPYNLLLFQIISRYMKGYAKALSLYVSLSPPLSIFLCPYIIYLSPFLYISLTLFFRPSHISLCLFL